MKGVSILIPVYNYNVSSLVQTLEEQGIKLNIPFEILLIDDASSNEFVKENNHLSKFENVTIKLLESNIGRSKIRNLLFEMASYDSCLIMDCDVLIENDQFLENYLDALDSNVVVGGHKYDSHRPIDSQKYFHWLYGSRVEAKSFKSRMMKPYDSFMTNCFAITKTIFNENKFDETLLKYGHEDTLFGILLKENNIPILHIDNPVIHMGLDDEEIFVKKQKLAIENLSKLHSYPIYKEKLWDIGLVKHYHSVFNKFPLNLVVKGLNNVLKIINILLKNESIKLFNFSMWKLDQFSKEMKKLNTKIFST